MIYWITFHLFIIFFCFLFLESRKYSNQLAIASLICCFLIYFSTFKEGIGQDYEQYIKRLVWLSSIDMLSVGSEPLFNVIAYVIEKTSLSYLFLFLVSAIVANIGIVFFCLKERKYFPYMILLFVFYPVLYQQQFNLVRQFFAVGLFYFSLRFIGVSLWRYILCVFIAGLMHFSALFLLPFYWILNKRYERKWIILFTILFFLFLPIILQFVGQNERYESYIDVMTSRTMYLSGFSLVYNCLFLIVFLDNSLYKSSNPVYLNMLILLVLFIDASYINYGFYRFAIYFIPIIIFFIPFIMDKKWHKNSVPIIIALILLFYFNILISNSSLKMTILPLSALFD